MCCSWRELEHGPSVRGRDTTIAAHTLQFPRSLETSSVSEPIPPREVCQNERLIVSRRAWLLVGLFGLALVPRLLILAVRIGDLQFWEYETLAANIAAGKGYVISRFGHEVLAFGDGDLYSFLAGTLYRVAGHSPMLLAIIQA